LATEDTEKSNMCKHISIALIFLLSLQVAAVEHPTITELLDRYAETQAKLNSFVIKYEDTGEADINSSLAQGKVRPSKSGEIRFDSERVALRTKRWGYITPDDFITQDEAMYISSLWDGESYFSYSRGGSDPLGRAIIYNERHDSWNKTPISRGYSGHELMGFFFGDDERIDLVLQQADEISVREKLERVGEAQCYVVDATARGGKYTVWIDPEHGYNIAKAMVQKKEGGWFYGKRLPEGANMISSLKNVRFEKINDVWVPIEADIERTQKIPKSKTLPKGFFEEGKLHHKRTEVVLNPDHDALGSFVPDDILNGARVQVGNNTTIQYTWQNGQVVGAKGRVIMDCRPKNPEKVKVKG